eukprot:1577775-Amphidinium_carterae.1
MACLQPVASNSAEVDTLLNLLDEGADPVSPVYSPINTPAQVVESSSGDSSSSNADLVIPDFMDKTVQQALDILMVDSDA